MFDYEKECKDFRNPNPQTITAKRCGKCPLLFECFKNFRKKPECFPTLEDLEYRKNHGD
jgi:hypothetical protein